MCRTTHLEKPQIKAISALMQSPCTKVCQIDRESSLCIGCFRTLEEIAGWASYSATDRTRILSELPLRRLNAAAKEAS